MLRARNTEIARRFDVELAHFTIDNQLWLRMSLQICGYLRMIRHPDAVPVAVPKLVTIESQVQDEIAEVLGREELGREEAR